MRRLVVLLALLTIGGCFDNSGTEPLVSVNGIWGGTVGGRLFTIALGESSGVVGGTGSITNTPTGTRSVSIKGTYERGSVGNLNVTLTSGTDLSINLTASVNLTTMAGSLTGFGYSATPIAFTRQ